MPATYSTIPLFATYDRSSQSYKAKLIANQFAGKGTAEGRAFDGINSVKSSWSVSITITNQAEIEAFLSARVGCEPFTFIPDGVSREVVVTCDQWDWDWDFGCWTFQGVFDQVYRFG